MLVFGKNKAREVVPDFVLSMMINLKLHFQRLYFINLIIDIVKSLNNLKGQTRVTVL